jgi:hypothetical protein
MMQERKAEVENGNREKATKSSQGWNTPSLH